MARSSASMSQRIDLAEIFRSLARQRRSGTLKVSDGAGQAKYVYFRSGEVDLVRARRSRTPIGRALLKRKKIDERQLRQALKRQEQTGEKLGVCCVRMGACSADAIREALIFQAVEEVSDLFTWADPRSEFHRGEPPLDIFDFQDRGARLGLSADALVREARRRALEMLQLMRQIPSFADIYAPTPEALYAMKQPDEGSPEEELLRYLDGERDVDEVLEVVRLSDLEALRTLVKLVRSGEVMALTPHQLAQVAAECERGQKPEKAHRLYLRAEAAGLEQLDLPNRLAKLADQLGRREEAVARYLEFAERCRLEDLPEAAVAAYRKALELDPGSVQAMEEIVHALADLGKSSEAVAMLKQVARRTDPDGDRDKLQRCWQEVLRLQPEDLEAQRALVDIFRASGDSVQAIIQMEELAAIHISRAEFADAINVLREILALDPECVEAHLQLATTLAQTNQTEEAVREYEQLAESLSKKAGLGQTTNWQFLIDIYEKIVSLDRSHVRARQWLAQAYQEKAQSDKAVGNYEVLVETLSDEEGAEEELAEALKRLVELKPDDFVCRERLGRVLRQLGRNLEAAEVLGEARDRALKEHQFDAARRAAEQLAELEPFDVGAYKALARIAVLEKDEARAFQHYRTLAEICAISGRHGEGAEACRKALDLRAEADLRRKLAEALELGGNTREAAVEFVEAGRLDLQEENYGRARRAAEHAVELEPDLETARDLLYTLETRRAAFGSQSRPGWANRTTQKPSITGGGKTASLIERPERNFGSVAGTADKLRHAKGIGAGGETVRTSGNALGAVARLKQIKLGGLSGSTRRSAPPEEPGEAPAELEGGWQKAEGGQVSAAARLKALKLGGLGGGSPAPADGGGDDGPPEVIEGGWQRTEGKKMNAAARLKALKMGGGGSPAASSDDDAPVEIEGGWQKAESAPQSNAAARLKALKGGGGLAAGGAKAMPQKIEQGDGFQPSGGGKKALGAAAKLKALQGKGVGDETFSPGSTPTSISQNDDFQPASGGKKALGAAARLKALGGAGVDFAPPDESVPDTVESGDEYKPATGGGKAMSAAARLKALGGGAASAAATSGEVEPEPIPPDPGYQPAKGGGRALGAAAKLKALQGGGGGDPSPEASGRIEQGDHLQKASGGKKALGAAARLKALGGGAKAAAAGLRMVEGDDGDGRSARELSGSGFPGARSEAMALDD